MVNEQHPPEQRAPHGTGVTPSGTGGWDPSTAGPGKTDVQSSTPENAAGRLDPSSPEDATVTPGPAAEK